MIVSLWPTKNVGRGIAVVLALTAEYKCGRGVSDLSKGSTDKRKITLTTTVEQNRVGVCG